MTTRHAVVSGVDFAYHVQNMILNKTEKASVTPPSSATPALDRFRSLSALAAGAFIAWGYVQVCIRWGDWRTNALVLALAAAVLFLGDAFGRLRPNTGKGDRTYVIQALVSGVLFAFLFVFLAAAAAKVRQVGLPDLLGPFSVNPIEGREAVKAWLLRHGENIYSNLNGYPLLITLYPPLYYAASAAVTFLVGPGLLAAKLASLVGLFLMLAMLYALARRGGVGRLLALAAPLVFFLTPEATCGFLCKPDTMAVGLVLGAAFLFEGAYDAPRASRRLTLAAVCLALAALTKQQTWPLAAGFVLYGLFVPGLRRRLPRFVLTATLALAALAAVFFLYAGKELFLQVVVFPSRMTTLENLNRMSTAWERLGEYGASHAWLVGTYAGWLLLCLYRRRLPLVDLLALVSLPVLFRVLAWSGSDINHFLFLSAVSSLGAVRLAAVCLARPAPVMGLGLVLLAGFQPVNVDLGPFSAADFAPRPEAMARISRLRQVTAEASGPVLVDNEGAYAFLGRPEFSRLCLYDAFETDLYDQLGLWPLPTTSLVSDIRARRFALFLDSDVIISSRLRSLLSYYYAPRERIGRYTLYAPRPEQDIVIIPVADRVARRDHGLTAVVVQAENVKNFGSYIQSEAPDRPLRLVYAVRAERKVRKATVVLCPYVVVPGATVELTFEDGEGTRREGVRFTWENTKRSGGGWENRAEVSFTPDADVFQVSLTLDPDAQLWLDEAHPLAVMASY